MMKKLIFVAVLASFLATPVFADMMIQLYEDVGYGTYSGFGPFSAKVVGTSSIGKYNPEDSFETFCLEGNEFFDFYPDEPISYYVTLGLGAINGGAAGQTSSNFDPLSDLSKGLYNNWLNTSDPDRSDTLADDTQTAIWYQEEELGAWEPDIGSGVHDLLIKSGLNTSNVMVMNLWENFDGTNYSGHAQDMMVSVVPVPVPGAFLLGSMGLGFATWRLKRRNMA